MTIVSEDVTTDHQNGIKAESVDPEKRVESGGKLESSRLALAGYASDNLLG